MSFSVSDLSLTFVMNVNFTNFTFDSLSGVTSQYLLTHVAGCWKSVCCLLEEVSSLTNTTTTTTTIPGIHLRAQSPDGGHPGRGVAGGGLLSTRVLLAVVSLGKLKPGLDNVNSGNIWHTVITSPQRPLCLLVAVLAGLLAPLVSRSCQFIRNENY